MEHDEEIGCYNIHMGVFKMGAYESEDCDELTGPKDIIEVDLKIPSFLKAYYIMFTINGMSLYGLVDGGSPYTFINQEIYDLVLKEVKDFGQKEIPTDNVILLGAFGKICAKVLKSVLTPITFVSRKALPEVPALSIKNYQLVGDRYLFSLAEKAIQSSNLYIGSHSTVDSKLCDKALSLGQLLRNLEQTTKLQPYVLLGAGVDEVYRGTYSTEQTINKLKQIIRHILTFEEVVRMGILLLPPSLMH